jgi:subtilase family serine protease
MIFILDSFPSTCPYVTSVGATQIPSGSTVSQPEVACQDVIFSGGGFSNQFKMPGYQKPVMAKWRAYKPNYPPSVWNSTNSVSHRLFGEKMFKLLRRGQSLVARLP